MTISGTECLIKSVSSTKIECYTGSFTQSSVKALIELYVDEVGLALNVNNNKLDKKIKKYFKILFFY